MKSKKKPLEKEKTNQEELGKKFEDLTPEEMQKIQGSGDMQNGRIIGFDSVKVAICMQKKINGYS